MKSSWIPLLTLGTVLVVVAAAATTMTSSGFVTPALASDLTIEDLMSREDLLQDKVTICHVPEGDITKAHDITVGESVVPNHLAHGDRIGNCLLTQSPTITIDPPTSCTSTENGLIASSRVILSGFPIGLVIITGVESPGSSVLVNVQSETHSLPLGFSPGEKTLMAFADANRNLVQDPGEVSAATSFTVMCW